MASMDSVGLLMLRVGTGASMALGHGWGKFANFSSIAATFPDPLGVGHKLSLGLAVFAELFCASALILGLGTRFAAAVLAFTMGVAAIMVHEGDPFAKRELAVVYFVAFAAAACLGGGAFSLDARLFRGGGGKKKSKKG